MRHFAMKAERRDTSLSKGQRKQLRHKGHILASVYGRDMDPVAVVLNARDVRDALSMETTVNTLIDLTVDGKKHLVRMENIEIDPIERRMIHISLHKIKTNEAQKAIVPVELTGEPEAVRNHDAILERNRTDIEIKAMPERLPSSFALDISDMQMGEVRRVGDLTLPKGVELVTDAEMPLVSLAVIRAQAEPDAEPASESSDDGDATIAEGTEPPPGVAS
jgi:large subunit ribosomal protein L25